MTIVYAKSKTFKGGYATAPCSVHVRLHRPGEFVVHYRNEQDKEFFSGFYTPSLPTAFKEFTKRVNKLSKNEARALAREEHEVANG